MTGNLDGNVRPSHLTTSYGHGSPVGLAKPPGGSNLKPSATPRARHCWVMSTRERRAGLLLEWARHEDGRWQGLVAHPAPGEVVMAWVPAGMLRPTAPQV